MSTSAAAAWTAPRFLEVFASRELTPGEGLSLKCTATGIPLPQITWSLDGFALDSLPQLRSGDYVTNENYVVSFVNVSTVRTEHGGSYSCRASSEAGTIVNTAVVRVLGDPVVRPMANWTATAGADVAIKCPVGGWPVDDVLWEKGQSCYFFLEDCVCLHSLPLLFFLLFSSLPPLPLPLLPCNHADCMQKHGRCSVCRCFC